MRNPMVWDHMYVGGRGESHSEVDPSQKLNYEKNMFFNIEKYVSNFMFSPI